MSKSLPPLIFVMPRIICLHSCGIQDAFPQHGGTTVTSAIDRGASKDKSGVSQCTAASRKRAREKEREIERERSFK